MKLLKLLVLFISIISCLNNEKVVVGYFESWNGNISEIKNTSLKKLTHLYYAFALIEPETKIIKVSNTALLEEVREIAKKENVKFVVSIGGWEGSQSFSDIVKGNNRNEFVENVSKFITDNKLDGVDFDWEYPGFERTGVSFDKENDMNNYMKMIIDLRKKIGKKTISLCGSTSTFIGLDSHSSQFPKFVDSIDFINVMSYHYYGAWDDYSGPNAPLYFRKEGRSIDETMKNWANVFPKSKLVVGLSTFGVVFPVVDFENPKNISQPVCKKDKQYENGKCKNLNLSSDILSYKDINDKSAKCKGCWECRKDEESNTPLCINAKDNLLLSYDNEESISIKANYIAQNDYLGAMIWSLVLDDRGKLVNTISNIVRNNKNSFPINRELNNSELKDKNSICKKIIKHIPENSYLEKKEVRKTINKCNNIC